MEETARTAADGMPSNGRFVWHELLSTDAERSGDFYAELLDWKVQPQGDGHALLQHTGSGRPVASLTHLGAADGVGSCWVGCVDVDDLEGFVRGVQDREGAVALPPTAGGGGRHALVADRRGALLAACSADERERTLAAFVPRDPSERGDGRIRRPSPGHFCWDQLNTHHLAAALADYAALLSWKSTPRPVSKDGLATTPGATFWCRDCVAAGALQLPKTEGEEPPVPDHWLPFVRVDRVAGRVGRAVELGGRVVFETRCDDDVGCFAVVQDPTGAVIALCDTPPADAKS
jgi:hypothetical protein